MIENRDCSWSTKWETCPCELGRWDRFGCENPGLRSALTRLRAELFLSLPARIQLEVDNHGTRTLSTGFSQDGGVGFGQVETGLKVTEKNNFRFPEPDSNPRNALATQTVISRKNFRNNNNEPF